MISQTVDILIFAVVALFFLVQLWRVLGRRTGTERPPPPIVSRVTTPVNPPPVALRPVAVAIPAAEPPEAGLVQIGRVDPKFRPAEFLDGAKHAFELIVKAFAEGDTASLRSLLSDEVYDTFVDAVRHRLAAKETVETKIERLDDPQIIDGHLDGGVAFVTVKFVTSQLSVTHAADGTVVEGDADHPIERTDFWTFSRNTRSADPNWLLVGTGEPE